MEGLIFFGTLAILTLTIFGLLFFIWKKHGNWTIVIGIAMLYYWSLSGAWFIIYDLLSSNAGAKWGVHYYYYFEKLFRINLNVDYLYSIVAYGFFIITVELVLFLFPIKANFSEKKIESISIYHPALIIIALLALGGSIFFNYEKIIEAIQNGESIYVFTRFHQGKFFTLHQLCNEIAVVTLLMGIAILLSGEDAKYLRGKKSVVLLVLYLLSFTIVMLYLVILGNRHDLIFGGLIGLYLLYFNLNKIIKPFRFISFILMIAIPLLTTDTIRSLPWGKYFGQVISKPSPVISTASTTVTENISSVSLIQNILFSNEMFAAHMSMYGAIHYNIPLTYGSSVVSLGASIVPRIFWENRPLDIYPYYAKGVHYNDEQGFTIHHVTGWYLNYGWLGILLGGLLFGWLWHYSLVSISKTQFGNGFKRIFFILLPCSIASFIPLFIRAGIEVYKPLFIEGILFPVIVIWFAHLIQKKIINK